MAALEEPDDPMVEEDPKDREEGAATATTGGPTVAALAAPANPYPWMCADYQPWSSVFLYDAGFGSVEGAAAHGLRQEHYIAIVKTAHSLYPKEELTKLLSDAPGDGWLNCSSILAPLQDD